MLTHFATIAFHSWKEIQTYFDSIPHKKSFEDAISSESRFVKINGNLYAISSISSVEFSSKEKEVKLYEELSEENKKIYDENKKAFPLYEIRKQLSI